MVLRFMLKILANIDTYCEFLKNVIACVLISKLFNISQRVYKMSRASSSKRLFRTKGISNPILGVKFI